MPFLLRIFVGLIVMVVGVLIVWKPTAIYEFTGPIEFAEEKLGTGGTYSFLKIIGVIITFIGIAIVTNIISDILADFAGIFVR